MVIVPVRVLPVFAAAEIVTVPLPAPVAAPAIVSHDTLLAAAQEQLVPAWIETLAVPPLAGSDVDVG